MVVKVLLIFLSIESVALSHEWNGPCGNSSYSRNGRFWGNFFEPDNKYYVDLDTDSGPNSTVYSTDIAAKSKALFLDEDIIPSDSKTWSMLTVRKWPNAMVPFLFSKKINDDGRRLVLQAMNEYHRLTCVQFKWRTTEEDYLAIVASGQSGCASLVGRQGGAQRVHLPPICLRVGIVLHELMHALGFFHEHMRPNRDNYVYINYSNIDYDMWGNFDKVQGDELDDSEEEYDFASIMHYRLCAMSNNSWPPIVPLVILFTIFDLMFNCNAYIFCKPYTIFKSQASSWRFYRLLTVEVVMHDYRY